MKKALIVMATLFLPAVLGAQDLPSVDQILDKYVQALGGKENVEKASSRVSKGTLEIPEWEVKGPHEIYAKAPNKLMSVSNLGDGGMLRQGFNGTAGWADDPDSGVHDVTGGELAELKDTAQFHRDLKLKEVLPGLAVKGKQKAGDGEAYVLETTAGGLLHRMYFDTQSGLLVRSDHQTETPDGKVTAIIMYEDYRDVDGVKVPFTIENNSPTFGYTLTLTEVKLNVPIDDSKFEKPAK